MSTNKLAIFAILLGLVAGACGTYLVIGRPWHSGEPIRSALKADSPNLTGESHANESTNKPKPSNDNQIGNPTYFLSLGMSPDACYKAMTGASYERLSDGTVQGAWGFVGPTTPFPTSMEGAVADLGIEWPYGAQIWQRGDEEVRLHFAGNKHTTRKEPMLFWVESMHWHDNMPDRSSNATPQQEPSLPPP